jgi:hypothetical protein
MFWECSECGGRVEGARAPTHCRECGTAGVIFVRADDADPISGDPEATGLRAVWLNAALERTRVTAGWLT